MKTFRYKLGHVAGRTLTVAELVEKLKEYPSSMPVFAEWEGVKAYIEPEMFETLEVHKGYVKDNCLALVIDVNGY